MFDNLPQPEPMPPDQLRALAEKNRASAAGYAAAWLHFASAANPSPDHVSEVKALARRWAILTEDVMAKHFEGYAPAERTAAMQDVRNVMAGVILAHHTMQSFADHAAEKRAAAGSLGGVS